MHRYLTATEVTAAAISSVLRVDPARLGAKSTLGELGADSIDIVEIALRLEVGLDAVGADVGERWTFDTTVEQVCADVAACMAENQKAGPEESHGGGAI